MKKKLISILMVTILSLNILLCNAINISFEDLDDISNITENIFFQDNNTPFEVMLNNKEDENNITQSINLLSTNNSNLQQPYISNNVLNNLNYTTINLTDLATGEMVTHDCNLYLVSNFDETNHWQECSICGKKFNIESHNYIDRGWTMGSSEYCNPNNIHQFVCNCGFSYSTKEGKKEHSFITMNMPHSYNYLNVCTVCDMSSIIHECIKSDGTRITCSNPGKCALCGCNYKSWHRGEKDENGVYYCIYCNRYMGKINSYNIDYNSDGTVTINYNISINENYTSLKHDIYNVYQDGISMDVYKNQLNYSTLVTFNQHYETKVNIAIEHSYYLNNEFYQFYFMNKIAPEIIPPVINNVQINNIDDWSTDSMINVFGTENYCNSVYLTLKDTEDNIYLENIAIPVNNGNWNYEIKPNIEVKENTEFILTVKDTLDNKTTKSFYLSKIDNKPPTNIGKKETSTDWSKTKDYITTTTDCGIGQVQTSVNDTENYELATEENNTFYKGYTFTGDVYGSTLVPIYSKDGLGNTSTEFIKVYNLDNTSPTIENINLDKTLHNTNVTIQANDINTKLNAEGSGITGYAITTENIEPTDYQESNTFTITKPKTYYIWVRDLVGNVTSKEMYLPVQYKVTINPDGGTWKGSTKSQEVIISSNEKLDLSPIPEKEGYTFSEWKVTGEGYITNDGKLVITGSDVEVIPLWETNQYSVTYIDYDLTNNKTLTEITKQVDYSIPIRGFDLGSDVSDNAYYNQYRLVSDTESKVSTSNNTVYRYFEFCYTEKSSHIDFNDNDNIDNLRPETYTLQLQLEDGTLIGEVTLSSNVIDYTFEKLPKYDENGKEYAYTITPIISDRYKVTPNPETGEPEISYTNPKYSILIPKLTTLNGKTGDLNYTLKVNSTLFYHDKISIIPDTTVLLTDGISTLTANIIQDKVIFTKEDIMNHNLNVDGKIQISHKHYAGNWIGAFNFEIKYETSN